MYEAISKTCEFCNFSHITKVLFNGYTVKRIITKPNNSSIIKIPFYFIAGHTTNNYQCTVIGAENTWEIMFSKGLFL